MASGIEWVAERVDDGVAATVSPHESAGFERLQTKGRNIELASDLRVCGQENLEAAIEEKAVDPIGTHAAADIVGRFEHHDFTTGLLQGPGRSETGEAGTDNDDLGVFSEFRHRNQ
jgi:hypothetical protein